MFIFFEECLFIQANTHEESGPRTGPFGNCFFHAFRIFYAHKVDHKVINALKCDIKTLQGNTTKFLLRGLPHSTHNNNNNNCNKSDCNQSLWGTGVFQGVFAVCSALHLRLPKEISRRKLHPAGTR